MSEFFRGWRRKIGVVTLLMALAATGGWVRSQTRFDTIMFMGRGRLDWISSHDGVLSWLSSWNSHAKSYPRLWPYSISSQSIDTPSMGTGGERLWQQLGFDYQHSYSASEEGDDLKIPYWSIVVPLTLISAYLLLSKPRKSTQKKIAEPVPTEGT